MSDYFGFALSVVISVMFHIHIRSPAIDDILVYYKK